MKRFLLFAQFLFANFSFGQITLEHYYAPETMDWYSSINYTVLSPCDFKYYRRDTTNTLLIYNDDHSLYKNIPIPTQQNPYYYVTHVSNMILNTDSNDIEYIVIFGAGGGTHINIYSEDGTILFADSLIGSNMIPLDYFMFNKIIPSPTGLKLIIRYYNSSAKVYSLPGELPQNCPYFMQVLNGDNKFEMNNAFPNPSSEFITVPYSLPDEENVGEIIISNSQGQEVKRYKVDKTFNSLQLNVSDFSDGMYFYQLYTSSGASETKKIIKMK